MNKYSNIGNLTEMTKMIEFIIEEFSGTKKPAFAIAFSLENTNYKEAHWVTNVSRDEGIKWMRETADKMEKQIIDN